jgi:membrane associated rhomboid family serine protease
VVTVAIILLNAAVFWLELSGGEPFVAGWALVPAQIVAGHGWITLLTAMFLHGGWLHLLGNMLFFWVFGPVIEDAMGSGRYLAFYLAGGLVASFAQIAIAPNSTVPILGASGAIAAVMGGFMITYPTDKIKTVLFLGFIFLVPRISAVVLIGLWFLTQVMSVQGALATTQTPQGGVAYMAHVAGFLFGLVTARFIEDPQRLADQTPEEPPADFE